MFLWKSLRPGILARVLSELARRRAQDPPLAEPEAPPQPDSPPK